MSALNDVKSAILLSAVTATGIGNSYSIQLNGDIAVTLLAASVTSGGTVKIQVQNFQDTTNWYDLQAIAATTAGTTSTAYSFNGPFTAIRGNVTARTDGTFTLYVDTSLRPMGQ